MFFSYTIVKKNNTYLLYLQSEKFFFFLELDPKKTKIIRNAQGFELISSYFQKQQNVKFLQYLINTTIRSWEIYFYKKFKFKSKGLKIKRKKKKILKFFFWLSHINLAIIRNCKIRRIGKQKYVFVCSNWIYLKKICKQMQDVRPNNLFTKKGIRFGRQIVTKKRGKKVTFI